MGATTQISRSFVVLGLAWSAALVASFFSQPRTEPELRIATPLAAPTARAPAPVALTDVSLDWGVVPMHQQISEQLTALTETLGGAVSAIDADRDGWMDLFFVGGSGATQHYGRQAWWHAASGNRLLRNQEGRRFEDVTERAGLQAPIHGMACGAADLDNDGFRDLIVTGVGDNRIFRNNGDLTFRDVTAESGIAANGWSTGASLSDFNGDGLLDLYLSSYILFEKGARTFERASGFRPTIDVAFDHTLYDPEPSHLYLNLGDLRFRDVTAESGISSTPGRSLGSTWIDVNDDRWPDLLILDDHGSSNQLYLNDRGRAFTRAGARYAALEVAGTLRRVIKAASSDLLDYSFTVPSWAKSPLTVTATLKYRKLNDRYARWALEGRYRPIPVVDMAWDSLTIPIRVRKEVE